MSNELLFFISAIVDILFVLFAARRGVDWLFGTVIANLILVGIFGAKLITIFGLVTNAGNVFYACVFLATYFLLERHGRRAGLKTIWYGVGFTFFFIAMSQFAANFSGLSQTDAVNASISSLFSFSLRITLASILSYIFAQYANIIIYEWIKARSNGKYLWLRANCANIISQLVDSLLFFSIAFFDLPGPILVQAILTGWFIKTLVIFIGVPFIYLDSYLERKKS